MITHRLPPLEMRRVLSFEHTRLVPFGPGSYRKVHELQLQLVQTRGQEKGPDVILLGEHERVITLGRATKDPLPDLPIPVERIERGGQATWHGPGQLVGYPILDLQELGISVRTYLRELELSLIDALAVWEIEGEVRDGATGVWVGSHKIASLGVAVRRWITYHGFALNVAPDLEDFGLIQPCGYSAEVMTSMAQLLPEPPSLNEMSLRVVQCLVRRLQLAPPIWESAIA